MATRIIVPHRGLEAAKTRLAPSLDPEERVMLASQLLQRVLKVSREVSDDVEVISPSRPLAEIVEAAGARLAVQRGMGLNEGLEQARSQALLDVCRAHGRSHGDDQLLRRDHGRDLAYHAVHVLRLYGEQDDVAPLHRSAIVERGFDAQVFAHTGQRALMSYTAGDV